MRASGIPELRRSDDSRCTIDMAARTPSVAPPPSIESTLTFPDTCLWNFISSIGTETWSFVGEVTLLLLLLLSYPNKNLFSRMEKISEVSLSMWELESIIESVAISG
ncbi:hypothetical protein HanRHA438_Chr14g0651121 [Helianthus annuus]|nr:hypothetical protein HanRHA438_Chr14g0651121 [Helianthus annuus]